MITNDNLPDGWVNTFLGEIAEWGSGGTPSRRVKEYFEGDIPWIKTGELNQKYISDSEEKISRQAVEKSSAKIFPKGSVGIAMYGATIGKLAIWNVDASTNQACAVAKIDTSLLFNEFLYYFLLSEKSSLIKAGKGGAQPNISQGVIKSWSINLPPFNEQHRIVAKIEELFSEIDKGVESLKTAKAQLHVYRQALLKHAFEGKLTAQWRSNNPDKVVPAEELLRSIEQAREERYQQQLTNWQTAVEKWEFNGKEGKKPSKPKRNLNNSKKIDASHLNLPSNWDCVNLESLLLEGPTNGYSPKAGENAKGTKSLKLTATTSCKMLINQDTIKYLYEEIEEGSKYWLKPGDVLVQRANTIDYVGSTAIYQGSHNDFIYPDLMIRLRFYSPILSVYIWHFLNYSKTRLFFRKNATGIAGSMPKISGEILKSTPVQITGYSEMEILTQELDAKLSIIDRFEDDCNLAIQQAEMLRQSILKKAFSGQLIPQDPTDEPASELLKRIQAEKAERETTTKKQKVKSSR